MALLLSLLLAAVADSSTVPLAPAPGAPPAPGIVVSGHAAPLDAEGRGTISSDGSPAADGLRFYRTAPDSSGGARAYYYPADSALASWKLPGVETSAGATVVLKDAAVTWESARSFPAPLEKVDGGRRLRFALSPGTWDVAVVVPGFAPGFVTELDVYAEDETLNVSAVQLDRAGRVTARVLDARTGKPPDQWKAYASGVGADPESVEAKFFDGWPISSGGATLDFASLPVGGWELRVVAPRRSEPHVAASVPKAGALVELGDLYVTDFGKLRVVLEFPGSVPAGSFEVKLTRSRVEFEGEPIVLGKRTTRARGDAVLEFDAIEPGDVDIECGNADAHIWRNASVIVEPNRTAEARIVFRQVQVHGTVRRGDEAVPGAQVSKPSGRGRWGAAEPVVSDELGGYALDVWGGTDTIVLTTVPPGQTIGYSELVSVDPEAIDVPHDVLLPGGEIRGVVRDADTGVPLAGAEVGFTTAIPEEEPEDLENYTMFVLGMETDAEGRFRLANLEEDEDVDVEVTLEGYSPSRFADVRPKPGGTELDVRLERGVRVSGTVVDESGAPLAGIAVGLDIESRGQDFARTATTSSDGRYEFAGVADGPHVLGLLACGRTIVLRRFAVDGKAAAATGSHTEDIQVTREGSPIDVHLEHSDGSEALQVVRFAIDGVPLPLDAWWEAAKQCGTYDEIGWTHIVLHGFPQGTITALSSSSQTVYGTYQNDGSGSSWTIRLPGADLQAEVEKRVAR